MKEDLSPLERRCIELIANDNWPSFRLDGLRVLRRESTGVGKFVTLRDLHQQHLSDNVYETRASRIEMEGVELGLDLSITVSDGRIDFLELVTPGDDGWDGVERPWRIFAWTVGE